MRVDDLSALAVGPSLTEPALNDAQVTQQQRATPSSAQGENPAVILDLSDEAKSLMAGAGAMTQQQTPPPTTTLPTVVVQHIQVSGNALAQQLLAQQPPGSPDYGAIALAVNQYYSSQYALAGEAVSWVNARVTIDPAVMNDPVTAQLAMDTRDELIALIYKAKANPAQMVNGPGSTDITGAQLLSRMQNVNFQILGGIGSPLPTAHFAPNANGDGGLVTLYPAAYGTFFGGLNMSSIGQSASVLFHEVGHALLAQELQASWNTFYTAGVAAGMSPSAIQTAYLADHAARQAEEARATAMGMGAAELAGHGANFRGDIFSGGVAPR